MIPRRGKFIVHRKTATLGSEHAVPRYSHRPPAVFVEQNQTTPLPRVVGREYLFKVNKGGESASDGELNHCSKLRRHLPQNACKDTRSHERHRRPAPTGSSYR